MVFWMISFGPYKFYIYWSSFIVNSLQVNKKTRLLTFYGNYIVTVVHCWSKNWLNLNLITIEVQMWLKQSAVLKLHLITTEQKTEINIRMKLIRMNQVVKRTITMKNSGLYIYMIYILHYFTLFTYKYIVDI